MRGPEKPVCLVEMGEGRNQGGSLGTGPGQQGQKEHQKFPLLIQQLCLPEAVLADPEIRAGQEGEAERPESLDACGASPLGASEVSSFFIHH